MGPGVCFTSAGVKTEFTSDTQKTMTASSTNYVFLDSSCTITTNTTGFVGNLPIATVVTDSGANTSISDDRSWFIAVASSSGGADTFPFDQCTPGQTANAGNSFWNVISLTNWDAGVWEFVKNSAADVWCSIRVPSSTSSTPHILIDLFANDGTSGHTVQFQTCDVQTSSLNPQVGSLTCASNQTFTTTSTAYASSELSFAVQATVTAGQVLVVKIHQTASNSIANDTLMYPPKYKIN